MTVRRWPDSCPGPSTPGYSMQGVDQSLRTSMEVGSQRVRRRTFARLDRVKMQWVMTPVQYAAFCNWYYGNPVSIAGASDSLSGWSLANLTRLAAVAVSPEAILVDRLREMATTAGFSVAKNLSVPDVDNLPVIICATIRAAGRNRVRLSIIDRGEVENLVEVNLTSGTVTASNGVVATVQNRKNGWWRITAVASTGAGSSPPQMRIRLLDGGGASSYGGDNTKGIEVCEVQARIATGYDLFVPADANGQALGADGGSAWFFTNVPTEAGLQSKEAKFTAMFTEEIRPGLNRIIAGELEIRYA